MEMIVLGGEGAPCTWCVYTGRWMYSAWRLLEKHGEWRMAGPTLPRMGARAAQDCEACSPKFTQKVLGQRNLASVLPHHAADLGVRELVGRYVGG